jgi:hypothetical protein
MTEIRWCDGCAAEAAHELLPTGPDLIDVELACLACGLGLVTASAA